MTEEDFAAIKAEITELRELLKVDLADRDAAKKAAASASIPNSIARSAFDKMSPRRQMDIIKGGSAVHDG